MPSPLGHALAGAAAGWLVLGAPRRTESRRWWREAVALGALATLADLDLLFGAHRGATHSVGAIVVVAVVAYVVLRNSGASRPLPGACACLLAYGSHVLLDWLGHDISAPIGVMAFWPISDCYYESRVHVFWSISRTYWVGWPFIRHNLLAVAWEVLLLLPLVTTVWLVRRRPQPLTRGEAARTRSR